MMSRREDICYVMKRYVIVYGGDGLCDDDMVRYFLSQVENGHRSDSETHKKERQARHTGNGELAGNEQLRLIRPRKNVTLTVKQPGKGTRPYCNICVPPLQIARSTR